MDEPDHGITTDLFRELFGIGPEVERLDGDLVVYRDILAEIAKLRALDLTDVHPSVVFDPTLPYRRS